LYKHLFLLIVVVVVVSFWFTLNEKKISSFFVSYDLKFQT